MKFSKQGVTPDAQAQAIWTEEELGAMDALFSRPYCEEEEIERHTRPDYPSTGSIAHDVMHEEEEGVILFDDITLPF